VVVFPLPQILAFSVEAVAVEPSTPIPEEIEFMDAFANLVLGRDPFVFPTLIENKR
jgi:hypothetical protein